MRYFVAYLHRARREKHPGDFDLASASRIRAALSRRGYTAWITDDKGRFVPVKGAKKEPSYLA